MPCVPSSSDRKQGHKGAKRGASHSAPFPAPPQRGTEESKEVAMLSGQGLGLRWWRAGSYGYKYLSAASPGPRESGRAEAREPWGRAGRGHQAARLPSEAHRRACPSFPGCSSCPQMPLPFSPLSSPPLGFCLASSVAPASLKPSQSPAAQTWSPTSHMPGPSVAPHQDTERSGSCLGA